MAYIKRTSIDHLMMRATKAKEIVKSIKFLGYPWLIFLNMVNIGVLAKFFFGSTAILAFIFISFKGLNSQDAPFISVPMMMTTVPGWIALAPVSIFEPECSAFYATEMMLVARQAAYRAAKFLATIITFDNSGTILLPSPTTRLAKCFALAFERAISLLSAFLGPVKFMAQLTAKLWIDNLAGLTHTFWRTIFFSFRSPIYGKFLATTGTDFLATPFVSFGHTLTAAIGKGFYPVRRHANFFATPFANHADTVAPPPCNCLSPARFATRYSFMG